MKVSVVSRPGVNYPSADDYFSPHERYPEYAHDHVARSENPVYEMVRQTFAQAGLDEEHYGQGNWNPLGEFIDAGNSVFVLCNFVCHRRVGESNEDFQSKCTHASVIRAILDYVLIAVGGGGKVTFGNAALQGCQWERVLQETGSSALLQFYSRAGAPVQARDLRLFVVESDLMGRSVRKEVRDSSHAAEVDLESDSLLRAHYDGGPEPHYRVLDYDPRRTERCHSRESHRYLVHKAVLESDVVLSVPKLKTHQKVGVTLGLKGFVGTVGHKDCLAHHRLGGARTGGDEYPGGNIIRHLASRLHDWVYSRDSSGASNTWRVLDRSLRRAIGRMGGIPSGGWSGNDTAWRMSLDLGRIVHNADAEGLMRESPQRRHLCFIDGIRGGEGEGPLSPKAVDSGVVVFSDDVALADRVACRLMGLDPSSIPLVHQAFRLDKWPITRAGLSPHPVAMNGERITEAEILPVLSRPFLMPRGWRQPAKPSR